MRFNFTKHLSAARKRNVSTLKADIFWFIALTISIVSLLLIITKDI